MTADLIPDEVKQFIIVNIDSIAQLEALLLLRANPQERWYVYSAAKRLYISEQETLPLLDRLCELGLIARKVGNPVEYVYQPASDYLVRMVDQIAEIYAKHLVPVTKLIHSKPLRIQEFADAFKLRKDE